MKYQTVIITGASSGLGEEFAHQFAVDTEHLVLVARREDRLQQLKEILLEKFNHLTISVEAVDLADRVALEALAAKLTDGTYIPHVLVNNAGLGDLGSLRKADWSKIQSMIDVNINALTRLTHAVIPGMCERKRGEVLNVSSLASTIPIPDFAVYAATKHYVTAFSEAVRMEVKGYNVGVTALCPGPVKTEFGSISSRDPNSDDMAVPEWSNVPKERCVREALNAMDNRKPLVFPGALIKLLKTGFALTPMPIMRIMMSKRPRQK